MFNAVKPVSRTPRTGASHEGDLIALCYYERRALRCDGAAGG